MFNVVENILTFLMEDSFLETSTHPKGGNGDGMDWGFEAVLMSRKTCQGSCCP